MNNQERTVLLIGLVGLSLILLPSCGGEPVEKRSLKGMKAQLTTPEHQVSERRELNTNILHGAEIGVQLNLDFPGGESYSAKAYRFDTLSNARTAINKYRSGFRSGYWIFVDVDAPAQSYIQKKVKR